MLIKSSHSNARNWLPWNWFRAPSQELQRQLNDTTARLDSYRAYSENLAEQVTTYRNACLFSLAILRKAKKAHVGKSEDCQRLHDATCMVVDLLHNAIPKTSK